MQEYNMYKKLQSTLKPTKIIRSLCPQSALTGVSHDSVTVHFC